MDDDPGGVGAIENGRNVLLLTSTYHTIEDVREVADVLAQGFLRRVGEGFEVLKRRRGVMDPQKEGFNS